MVGSHEETSRRQFVVAGSALALSVVSGCLSRVPTGLTDEGDTTQKRTEWTLGVENDTSEAQTLSLTVRPESEESKTLFEETFELSANESKDPVFTVEEPTSSRIVAKVDGGPKKTFTWKACTGYGPTVIFMYENDGEYGLGMRQPHSDPEAENCNV